MSVTEQEYNEAVAECDRINDMAPASGTAEARRLYDLALVIEEYERVHVPEMDRTQ